ncbi:MAG: beta-glucuronidase [Vallitaleaceae bacterium]|nr:beta-glucuronidase [Vallitaleaceae bacterium]
MIRLFKQHKIRQVEELEGLWDFYPENSERVYSLSVPGCWEQHPSLVNYRGSGEYRKKIQVNKETALRLSFKGVSHSAKVYFDGVEVVRHYNAYTAFDAVLTKVEAGEHEIRVWVDNRFNEASALHLPNDYYTYGGLIRPVSVEILPEVYIKKLHFTPSYLQDSPEEVKKWQGKIQLTICNLSKEEKSVGCACTLGEKHIDLGTIAIRGEEEVHLQWEGDFEGVEAWSHEDPKLYELRATINEMDDVIERVGFRKVEICGKDILVNGEKVFLKGFNRHEDYAVVGCSLPLQLMVQDMDLMQDLGVNALRTSHYPNDERFLDLCDERGIYVWEENHARGLGVAEMMNPNFDRQCADCNREMIEEHYNHPSIIIWGILNECASESEEGRRKYKEQFEQIKSLDVSRPTTFATCRHFTDISLDLPDIVSYNIYSGWYEDEPVKERNQREMDWIESAGGGGKPMIISEFGAGGIYGFRDRARSKWSEERQADILKECLEVYMDEERISGVFIWQFADCRITEEGGWFAGRPRSHNNKGMVDEYRRPKLVYDVVKEKFRGKA